MGYEEKVRDFVLDGLNAFINKTSVKVKSAQCWQEVKKLGTELWLDTGDIDEASRLWDQEFSALTTNNTLLNKEIQKGIYDDFIPQAANFIKSQIPAISEPRLVQEIAFTLNALHGLRLVKIFNAKVSVELHTDFANDVDGSLAYGKRFYDICPEHFIIKIPFTPAGVISAKKLGKLGVPINLTLGFSARQNYFAAIYAQPVYVNVFMGRLNAFVADNKLGDGINVGEKATLATQRALLELRTQKQTCSKLIGASMRAGGQVSSLAGLDVYTMPTKVAEEYLNDNSAVLTNQTMQDPKVTTNPGISLIDFNAASLWKVTEVFKSASEEFITDVDGYGITPEAVLEFFEAENMSDFMPRWTDSMLDMVSKDGKIPVFDHWKNSLAEGSIGLDALMNISALYSFISDQKALDSRILSLIKKS